MAAVLDNVLGRIPGLLAVVVTDKDGVVVVQCEGALHDTDSHLCRNSVPFVLSSCHD